MIAVGETAPSFTLPGATAERRRRYDLAEFTEEGLAVVSFYAFDFSPVCSTQLCSLRDVEWFQIEDDVDVVGISGDSAHAHQAFIREHDLPFPLLSDFAGDVAAAYGVQQEELEGHRNVPKRAVFVIDADREVRYAWVEGDGTQRVPMDDLAEEIQLLRP